MIRESFYFLLAFASVGNSDSVVEGIWLLCDDVSLMLVSCVTALGIA